MSTTNEIMGVQPKVEATPPRNNGERRLMLEIAAMSNMIRITDDGYDIDGFNSLPPAMRGACLEIARQYMLILAESMLEEGVVTEKNSAYLYLRRVDE